MKTHKNKIKNHSLPVSPFRGDKGGLLVYFVLLTSYFFLSNTARSQLYTDPVLAALTITNSVLENQAYSDMKSNQKTITELQTATAATVTFINEWQKKMYNGLLYVSSTVKNAYQIVACYEALQKIYDYEGKIVSEAKQNPLALAFSVKYQDLLVTKAIQYYGDINQLILKEGDDKLLMDAGERTILLNKVLTDLNVLVGYSYSAYLKVHWAVINGIYNTLNPFASYANKDKQIVKDVLKKMKF
jgi:hypothetical protein